MKYYHLHNSLFFFKIYSNKYYECIDCKNYCINDGKLGQFQIDQYPTVYIPITKDEFELQKLRLL